MKTEEQIEDVLIILRAQIEKLTELDFKFAASLIRVAELDLEVQLHRVDKREVDVLGFAANAVELERFNRGKT